MKSKILILLLTSIFLSACSTPLPTRSDASHGCGYAMIFDKEKYDDYLEHFQTAENVPNDFVHYEQIKELGSFEQFYAVSNSGNFTYDVYYYTLTDNCRHNFAIKIMSKEPAYAATVSPTAINPQDMRCLPNADKGNLVHVHDGIRYSYSDGKLVGVSWLVDNTYFSITFEGDMLSTFGSNHSGTIIDGLLSLNTASATRNSFAEMIHSGKQ